MHRTLQQLKESVEKLIEQQGEEAPCYSMVFTNEDVFTLNQDNDKQYFLIEKVEEVFEDMDDDTPYQYMMDKIDESMRNVGII